jgi:hypothetical protein
MNDTVHQTAFVMHVEHGFAPELLIVVGTNACDCWCLVQAARGREMAERRAEKERKMEERKK